MSAAGAGDLSTHSRHALLRDGTSVRVRAIRPDDKARLRAHFRRLGPESVSLRFMGAKKDLTTEELRYFTELDFVRHVGLVVSRTGEAEEEFIGVGRYVRLADAPGRGPRAEFALAVTDPYQGLGVGMVLLEHLARLAGAAGIERLEADILESNVRMLNLLAHIGVDVSEASREGVVRAEFPLRLTERALAASDQRSFSASARSIRALLQPRSVGLLGASRQPGTIGAALLANLRRDGFRGAIYPVNPKAETIDGIKAYPSVMAIGQPVDLQRHLRAHAGPARQGGHALPERGAGPGHPGLCPRAEHRALHVRVRGQQGRCVGQRPPRLLEGRSAHGRHRSLPRELRQPAPVRATGS